MKKKFNFESFLVTLVFCFIGALSNENAKAMTDVLLLVAIFGLPISILFGIIAAEEKE